MKPNRNANFAQHLQLFFTERLLSQRNVSPHTIAAYRDTFRILLLFAQKHLNIEPTKLAINDFNVAFISFFLNSLETERKNSVRTRNARLAAIHSFFRYLALQEPIYAALAQQILAIPPKRARHKSIAYLTENEVQAILSSPNLCNWTGRRDRAMLTLAIQTGLRVSELRGLRNVDLIFGKTAYVQCCGKGRKERCTPLQPYAVRILRSWTGEQKGAPNDPLFPNQKGTFLSRDGVAYILTQHVGTATQNCPSLSKKRVTPHVLRHTTAMTLLNHGIDRTVIALWLGHQSVETTEIYFHEDMQIKQRALDRTNSLKLKGICYKPPDHLLAFLESL
jgi:integrase/recombinase XerD